METLFKSRKIGKRSDWCKALSYYSSEQKICNNCLVLKNSLTDFILPISKTGVKLQNVNLSLFSKRLEEVNKPVLLKNENIIPPKSFLIYLSTELLLQPVIDTLGIESKNTPPAATIISPDQLSKNRISRETRIVRDLQKYFDPTGFIKLPIEEIADIIKYEAET